MNARDRSHADLLNDCWDAIVGNEPALAGTMQPIRSGAIQAISELSRAMSPRPEFVAGLEQRLLAADSTDAFVATRRRAWSSEFGSRVARNTIFREVFSHMGTLATAAMVILVLAGSLAVGWHDSGNRLPPKGTGWVANGGSIATPVASDQEDRRAVTFDECTVDPLPEGYMASLLASPNMTNSTNSSDSMGDKGASFAHRWAIRRISSMPIAPDEDISGITWTLRQFSACRFYNSTDSNGDGRFYALFSDDNLQYYGSPSFHPFTALSNLPPQLTSAHVLPDGRIAAFIRDSNSYFPGTEFNWIVLFDEEGGMWKVDAVLDVGHTDQQAPPGVPAAMAEFILAEASPGYRMQSAPFLFAGERYWFVFHNVDDAEHTFSIPSLNISVTVPAFQTRDVIFTADAGEYLVVTFTGQIQDDPAPPPCDGGPLPNNILVVYPAAALNDKWNCNLG